LTVKSAASPDLIVEHKVGSAKDNVPSQDECWDNDDENARKRTTGYKPSNDTSNLEDSFNRLSKFQFVIDIKIFVTVKF